MKEFVEVSEAYHQCRHHPLCRSNDDPEPANNPPRTHRTGGGKESEISTPEASHQVGRRETEG